jgi:hypothetical protein
MLDLSWLKGLDHRDWLFDGHAIRGRAMIEAFNDLDWSKAWMDLGPSPTGNPGPYWHVPRNGSGSFVRRSTKR